MDALVHLGSIRHGGVLGDDTRWVILPGTLRGGPTIGPGPPALSVVDISPHQDGELLHKLPGVPGTRPRESFLNESDGIDGQRKVGSDGEYLFIDGGTARVRRESF